MASIVKAIVLVWQLIQDRLYLWVRAAADREDHRNMLGRLARLKYCGDNVWMHSIGFLYGEKYISIGRNTQFGKDVFLTAWSIGKNTLHCPEINIGCNCQFGAYNHITTSNRLEIGDNCLTGKWVTITDNSHGLTDYDSLQLPPIERPVVSKGPVIIGNNVWIGDKATILPNVRIGDGVVVAANAVVTHDVPAYCVVAGNPAIIVKHR